MRQLVLIAEPGAASRQGRWLDEFQLISKKEFGIEFRVEDLP